jgi:hypothetical protein
MSIPLIPATTVGEVWELINSVRCVRARVYVDYYDGRLIYLVFMVFILEINFLTVCIFAATAVIDKFISGIEHWACVCEVASSNLYRCRLSCF